jgi:hypothetical protein
LRNWKFRSSVFDDVASDFCRHALAPSAPYASKERPGKSPIQAVKYYQY